VICYFSKIEVVGTNPYTYICAVILFFFLTKTNLVIDLKIQNYMKLIYKLHISYSVITLRLYYNYICQIFRRKFVDKCIGCPLLGTYS
jgi:hypothetical protein